ncbi:L-rhamnose mutarotase [Mesorhizobium sp. L2C084A000]|uniref:L-rhamnose mutarotase n=1 Tax=unclassified Mesorhizobium TaxID=325217 RepID=UPI0003CFC219|nr:L-rhamnose mutarotase [Mesorhizobium sp. L2C084A000]ESZ25813.1 hypothetical protein X734_16760 [Mesorhizobium sp. L2C084A000]
MQRMGLCIGVKAEAIADYKRVHAAVWPEVLDVISRADIRNYSIFLREPENGGSCATPCRRRCRRAPTGEWRAAMEEVFHLD